MFQCSSLAQLTLINMQEFQVTFAQPTESYINLKTFVS